jgi:hypothetical protein
MLFFRLYRAFLLLRIEMVWCHMIINIHVQVVFIVDWHGSEL